MLVVLDSTVLCADFRMRGNAFRILFGGCRRVGLTPCLPEIVREKVINKYGEQCSSLIGKVERVTRDSSRVLGRSVLYAFATGETVEDLVSEYRLHLIAVTVLDNNFSVLPYPDVSHKQLVERALARRLPFP